MGQFALIAAVGLQVLGQQQQAEAATAQANAAASELRRQQTEANNVAQEEKSDRARRADREFASMAVAMETIGGAGSQNEARLGQEVRANEAVDLARIEGNRRRQIQSLQSRAQAALARGESARTQAGFNIASSLVDLGGDLSERSERRELNEAREEEAAGRTTAPLGTL